MEKKQYRINGFEQIANFYSMVFYSQEPIKPHHIALYMYLWNQNNRLKWVEWFKCSYDIALQGSKIGNKQTYYQALKDLKSFGFIDYIPGINNYKAPRIKLVCLSKTEPQSEPQCEPQPEPLLVPLSEPLPGPLYNYIVYNIKHLINNNIKQITEGDFDFEIIFKKKIENSDDDKQPPEEKKEEGGGAILIMPFTSDEFLFAWNNFLEMRRKKNKPVKTQNAKQLLLAKIKKLSANGEKKAIELLNQSTEKEWLGIFPLEDLTPKTNNYGRNRKNTESVTDNIKRAFKRIDEMYSGK